MDATFIVRRMQEEYQKKDKKLYMCFVGMKKAFDSAKKSDRISHDKEGSIKSNGLRSYGLE